MSRSRILITTYIVLHFLLAGCSSTPSQPMTWEQYQRDQIIVDNFNRRMEKVQQSLDYFRD